MSGQTLARTREAATGQPGGRDPAPGTLALVQAFINTHFDLARESRGADLLSSPAGLRDWLHARALLDDGARVGEGDLHRARLARAALRAIATRGAAADPDVDVDVDVLEALTDAARGAPVELRFTPAGPEYAATNGCVTAAIGLILAHAARAMLDGTWERLKICPGEHCGWAFYDHSRNRTGRWCSMSVCGGRAKARTHYHRHRHGSD